MNGKRHRLGWALLLAALPPALAAVGAADDRPPQPGEVERLIRQLGDDDFESRDMATRRLDAIGAAALPALNATLTAHRCSIVVDKSRVYSVNAAMDLTTEVIQKLNAALPTVTLQLAAPQQPAAPAAR